MFYLVAVFTAVIQVISFSLEAGVSYYSARNEITTRRLMAFGLGWSIISMLFVLLLFNVAGSLPGIVPDYPLTYPLAFIPGCLLIAFGNAICYSKYRYVLPAAVQILVSVVFIVLLQSGTAELDFVALFFYSFAVHGVLLFAGLMVTGREYIPDFRLSSPVIGKIFRYSSYAFIANLIFFIFNRVDYYFVKTYCSAAELGNFIQVSRIAQTFLLLPSMVSTVLFPLVASDEKNVMASHVRRISMRMLVLFSSIAIVPAVSGKWLFPWIFGESFDNMYIPFLLMAPGVICLCALYPYAAYFAGRNRIIVNVKGSLLGLAIVVVGDVLFVPSGGIHAAALVRGVGYIACQLSILSAFRKMR